MHEIYGVVIPVRNMSFMSVRANLHSGVDRMMVDQREAHGDIRGCGERGAHMNWPMGILE